MCELLLSDLTLIMVDLKLVNRNMLVLGVYRYIFIN